MRGSAGDAGEDLDGALRLTAMTPRHADVAYVLEGVAGVRGVFAVSTATHDLAVAVERGGGVLAEVHYALLRVLTYEELQRVHVFHVDTPRFIQHGRVLTLTEMDRAAARARVPPPAVRSPIVAEPTVQLPSAPRPLGVLLVSDDRTIAPMVYEAFDSSAYCVPLTDHVAAAELARSADFDVILCDSSYAFGLKGLLARLPLERAELVLVMVEPGEEEEAARRRLQGDERIVVKPVTARALRERVLHRPALTMQVAAFAIAAEPPSPATPEAPSRPATPRRLCTKPAPGSPFTAVLVDVPEDVAEALRKVFPIDSRQLSYGENAAAAKMLLSTPFHVAVVSARAALAKESVLSLVAKEDRRGSEKVIVLAPEDRDVAWVKHSLAQDGHAKQRVLALPIDDALLARELYRDHPELAERVAIAESDPFPSASPLRERTRVLIVDDDITTQMLRVAATRIDSADITLAATVMEAFEAIASASVSVLVVSASMRTDGGEPIYRFLWRLEPALKGRTVLVTSSDVDVPRSGVSKDHSRRIVRRPLTTLVVGRIVDLYRD